MTRVSAEGARRGWGRETGSESGLWAGAGGALGERGVKGVFCLETEEQAPF